jgi:hypothetical protein
MGILSSWPVSTMTHHAVKQWCAYKVGKKSYKYLILGDDTLDTSKEVYELYTDTIRKLGVSISLSKCTSSESGSTEFAKRLFRNSVEVTGLPVHLLESVREKPEQFLELVKIARERGYEDLFLGPCLDSLLSYCNCNKTVVDMLSLPEKVLGMPPLYGVTSGTWADKLSSLSEESLENNLVIARNYVFWRTAERLNKPSIPDKVNEVTLDTNHPLVYALSNKLMDYLGNYEDEYSIYNSWLEGNYREMASVPSFDRYKYYNKGHFVTKCKFDVLNAQLALANGDCNIPLHKPWKPTNYDLVDIGFNNTPFGY